MDAKSTSCWLQALLVMERFEVSAKAPCPRCRTPVTVILGADIGPLNSLEAKALACVAAGLSDGPAGEALGLTDYQVRYRVRRAVDKLAAPCRSAAVALCMAIGVVQTRCYCSPVDEPPPRRGDVGAAGARR
jgi:DNA-binding NarL/FixJ family response regulator